MSYVDEFVKRALRIERLSEGISIEQRVKFKTLKEFIELQLLKIEAAGGTTKVINESILGIQKEINKMYKEITKDFDRDLKTVIQKEINFNKDIFKIYSELENISTVSKNKAFDTIKNKKIQGRRFSDWYESDNEKTNDRVQKIIKNGFARGKTRGEITKEAKKLLNNSANEVKTLVRTNLNSASNEVRRQMVNANEDLFEYKIWVSVLDVRTTPHICGIRDGLKYTMNDEPIEHGEPWETGPGSIHFNCRSAWIPKIKGVPTNATRPAVGAGDKYQKGDKTTNRGTIRKPTKANREKGIFEIESGKNFRGKYEGWLRTQPKDFVADALGSIEKAERFKKGESLINITSNKFGKPVNVKQF